MRTGRPDAGYTLVEMVVTVLIIGILAAYGIPQYLKTVETGKADDAVALVNMIGTTNKMFALDHNNVYARGSFAACVSGTACPASGAASYTACDLIYCKYLADQNFSGKPYDFNACDPGSGTGGGQCSNGHVAAANRKSSASEPYSTWEYEMATDGRIAYFGTDVPTPTD
ncbi:MAG: type II secretion system protein [Elusimicrobia bacterium]|nr:type II secretion system protein [Elusimicrobiota bacterium]